MRDIFLSHAQEDAELAAQVAAGLEDAGYSTWHYGRDSLPGIPFVRQIPEAMDGAQAVVVVISTHALASPHIDREVFEAYRSGKRLIPLLCGLTHVEFRERKRDWALMLGATVFVTVPATGVSETMPRIVAGLRQLGVIPNASIAPEPAFQPKLRPTRRPESGAAVPRTEQVGGKPRSAPMAPGPMTSRREAPDAPHESTRPLVESYAPPARRGRLRVWSRRIVRTGLLAATLLVGLLYWDTAWPFNWPPPPPTATTTGEEVGGVYFPAGAASFADTVASYDPVFGDPGSLSNTDPEAAVGSPDEGDVSLGNGGSITLEFVDNVLTGSGDEAPDLFVFESGDVTETTYVEVSTDGRSFVAVGKVSGSTSSIDLDAFGLGPVDEVYFVRLTDHPLEDTDFDAPRAGADIDAVGAIRTAPTE